MDGRNRPAVTPEPRTIACVARGVVTNRVSSAAGGEHCGRPAPACSRPRPHAGSDHPPGQLAVGEILLDREGDREGDSLVVLGLLERGGVALEDPLIRPRARRSRRRTAGPARRRSAADGPEQPDLVTQLSGLGFELGHRVIRAGNSDDLVVQERLADDRLVERGWSRTDGDVDGPGQQQVHEAARWMNAQLDVQIVRPAGEQVDQAGRRVFGEQARRTPPAAVGVRRRPGSPRGWCDPAARASRAARLASRSPPGVKARPGAGSDEQPVAELLAQLPDVQRNRRFGDAQISCCPFHRSEPHYSCERAQLGRGHARERMRALAGVRCSLHAVSIVRRSEPGGRRPRRGRLPGRHRGGDRRLPGHGDGPSAVPGRRSGRRQDRAGPGAGADHRRRARAAAVLRGHRLQPGALRLGLPPPDPAPAGGRRAGRHRRARGVAVRPAVPDRAADPARAGAQPRRCC